jgi:hypothetical protein
MSTRTSNWQATDIGLAAMSDCINKYSLPILDDGILCELLCDYIYLFFNSHKFTANDPAAPDYATWLTPQRRLLSEALVEIIQQHVVVGRDVSGAVEAVLDLLIEPTEELREAAEKFTGFVVALLPTPLGDFKRYTPIILIAYLVTWRSI